MSVSAVVIRGGLPGKAQSVPIECGETGAVVTNNGPLAVYYADEAPVSASVNGGSLASGSSGTFYGAEFFVVDQGTAASPADSAALVIAQLPEAAAGAVQLVEPAASASVVGAAFFRNAVKSGYGDSFNVGDVPDSFGFSGTPAAAPATTITSSVTFPLVNATVSVADSGQLDVNGASFTLGGKRVAYLGRSASSGAGNATGCYSLASDTGTVASGTALGNAPTGYFALTVYKRFGYDGRPVIGSTQALGVIASYIRPPLDDSAEAGSFVTVMADAGFAQTSHKTVTGGEMTAQTGGNWSLLDGYTAALTGGGFRTAMTATDHHKNVIGGKISHVAGGFMQQYDGLYQTASALQTFGTLNGSATLPQATIPVTGTFPPATPANPVTVLIGANAQGVGGQQVTYTGQSGGSLTGGTGGTGTFASGTTVVNDVRGINVRDRVISAAGFLAGASGWSGGAILATKGGTDGDKSLMALTGPTNTDLAGGLTVLRLNAGIGAAAHIVNIYDNTNAQRLFVSAACALTLNGAPVIMQSSGTGTARIDSTGYVQPGVSIAAGAASNVGGSKIYSGTGVPALVGVLGDIYFRTDGGVGSTVYRCTTAGVAGVAVWTAIL